MHQAKRQFSASLVGQRLIEAGYLKASELEQALALQSETGLLLGEVCLLKGFITYDQLKECLPKTRSKIGDKLLASKLITMEQLWIALFEQRHSGHKLGQIIVSRGWVEQGALDQAIAREKGK